MTKGTEIVLWIIAILAGLMILIVVVAGLKGDIENWDVATFWFVVSSAVIFLVTKKIVKPTNRSPIAYSQPKAKSSVIGIVAVGLGLASTVMPYFAAVFFVPAAFICGAIAFRQGDRKFGGIAVVLAIVGVIGIISVSNQIGTAQRDLERSLRSLR